MQRALLRAPLRATAAASLARAPARAMGGGGGHGHAAHGDHGKSAAAAAYDAQIPYIFGDAVRFGLGAFVIYAHATYARESARRGC